MRLRRIDPEVVSLDLRDDAEALAVSCLHERTDRGCVWGHQPIPLLLRRRKPTLPPFTGYPCIPAPPVTPVAPAWRKRYNPRRRGPDAPQRPTATSDSLPGGRHRPRPAAAVARPPVHCGGGG